MVFTQTGHFILASFAFTATDHQLATWFHARLNGTTGPVLQAISFAAGPALMFNVLVSGVLFLAWKRRWHALASLVLTVPCGVLAGEALKLIVRRQRPYLVGPFVDWVGYSFPSGHAISATLLYGFLAVCLWRVIEGRHWRAVTVFVASVLALAVGFSRIALGAHYLTDVVAGTIFGGLWLTVCTTGMGVLRRRFDVADTAVPDGSPVLVAQ
jgi:undecaprenyl-diphosphatase